MRVKPSCVILTTREWFNLDHKKMVRMGFRDMFNGCKDSIGSSYTLLPKVISPQELADELQKYLRRRKNE